MSFDKELVELLKPTKLPRDVLVNSVVPVLLKLEISSRQLLDAFCTSSAQQQLALELGMDKDVMLQVIRVRSNKGVVYFQLIGLCFVFVFFAGLAWNDVKDGSYQTTIQQQRHTDCDLGQDFTVYEDKNGESEVWEVYHSTDRQRIENSKIKDLELKVNVNGYLCAQVSPGDKLASVIQQTTHALWLARELNRTLVVPKLMSDVYNIFKLQNLIPTVKYKIAIPYRETLCSNMITLKTEAALFSEYKTNAEYKKLQDVKISELKNTFPNDPNRFYLSSSLDFEKCKTFLETKGKQITLTMEDIKSLSRVGSSFIRAYYMNIWPRKDIVNTVDKFINHNFGDKPFAAVQLRNFNGQCETMMQSKGYDVESCSPSKEKLAEIMGHFLMENRNSLHSIPVFVLGDRENKDVLNTYQNDFFYKGACSGEQCMVIAYEIAARANFFVGVQVSKASVLIGMLRNHRQLRNGVFYPNILQWGNQTDPEMLQKRWFVKNPNNVQICPEQINLFW